jgi:hypothetical protein
VPLDEKRTVRARLIVQVLGGAGQNVGEFAVEADAGNWSHKENVQGLVQTAVERVGKKARAMAAGVDNNESARLK